MLDARWDPDTDRVEHNSSSTASTVSASPADRGLWPLLAAGLRGRPVFSTTARGVEFALMAAAAGARVMLLVQISASISTAFQTSPRRTLYAVYLVLGVGWAVCFILVGVRTRRTAAPAIARLDVLVAALCLVLQAAVVQEGQLFDSWTNWGYVYALNVLCATSLVRIGRAELACYALSLSALYLATRLTNSPVAPAAALSNVVSLLLFPSLIRVFATYLRRLGSDADEARATAVAAASAAERERHQLLLHDSATILRLLAADELPPQLAEAVRRQASTESNRIRRFLGDHHTGAGHTDDWVALTDVVQQSADTFSDLPIDVVTDLAGGVQLTAERAAAVRLALAGLLANVRVHARASHVVLHGDWDDAESEWELVVRDDGVGFDQKATAEGFGLEIQVRKALAAQGITVVVQSTPGNGTVVVLRGTDELLGQEVQGVTRP